MFLFFILNALQSYNNSNIVDVLRRKYVLGPSQRSFSKMSLSQAQNIFTPLNINYIVLVNSQHRLLHFWLFDWLKNSDYEPIVGVLRHMDNSAPSSLSGRFVKLWK